MLKKLNLALLPVILLAFNSFSQVNIKDTAIFVPMIYATYSYQFPSGDIAERYGSNSSIGGGLLFKTASNWLFGAEGNYMFGGDVKNADAILKGIATHDGFIIDQGGYYADLLYHERGYNFSAKFGKVIPVGKYNPNSGIMLIAGVGYLETKTRITAISSVIPSVEGDYLKGYDKLNGGAFLSFSPGYLYMSNSRLLNFYIGAEFMQSWTKAKRDFDFQTETKDTKSYSSQFYGIKIKWMIPLYKRKPKDFYLY